LDKNRTIVAKNLHAEQLEAIFEKELRKLWFVVPNKKCVTDRGDKYTRW
jgi:hypothetical protein